MASEPWMTSGVFAGLTRFELSSYDFAGKNKGYKDEFLQVSIMDIRIGTDKDIKWILEKYPYTSQVMHQGGSLVVASENNEILGFSWTFRRKIPVPIDKTEDFINVIEVFKSENRCRGIGSHIIKKCIDMARENGSYQIRAYCDANNESSNMLWVKNGFTISPVKMKNGQIIGSYVAYVL